MFDIITDKLANAFSLVEGVKESTNKKKQAFKLTWINQKNAIYDSKYDFTFFTVMDEVEAFKPSASAHDKPGLYYIETDQYFPVRGNGWYSHAMVKICVDNLLINESDTK